MPIMMELLDEANDETIILEILVKPLQMIQVKKMMRVKKLLTMCLMTDSRRLMMLIKQ
jgi:hypothetical protein